MSDRSFADANVCIALLQGPTHVHHEAALGMFRRVAEGEADLFVAPTVLVELTWYLDQRLGWPRERIRDEVIRFLAADGMTAIDGEVSFLALRIFGADRRIDFVDAHVAAVALVLRPPVVASFDRDFDRIEGITRIAS